MTTDPSVAAIVLAAGQGTRFAAQASGAPKLLADYRGAPMVRYGVTAALASRVTLTIVVTGHAREAVCVALAGLAFTEANNPHYASGMSSSLKAGIAALSIGAAAVIVLLGDMPKVSAHLIDQLVAAFVKSPSIDAVVPVHAGRRGNPVLLSRKLFPAIMRLTGDEGARKLLAHSPNIVEIDIDDDAVAFDVDTPDILRD